MAMPPRVVIDPNVYISATLTPKGTCGRLIDLVDDNAVTAITCPALIAELRRALLRPKLRRYISVDDAVSYCDTVQARTERHTDPTLIPPSTRDRADDYLVALANEAGADAITSGDPDLSEADLSVAIWPPRTALDILEAGPK